MRNVHKNVEAWTWQLTVDKRKLSPKAWERREGAEDGRQEAHEKQADSQHKPGSQRGEGEATTEQS